ncbi:TonB-dependent receptor [Sphingobium jiangsuense]|uniref:Iron complex outermembrane receptor protein n=1 Tax=Sphingobium jiangsuense TaxID=870476 RepID=A0A7W6FRZ1_9SPHN|nr:TonB-dependent receptor [Sphingobium jiangsuense]MBB3928498.1 iron complex outermembrane receptor protein [Sphingobium jiangsuense]GLT01060.1 TonB-dependent receptor [Sphingobium jiangsuense]
MRTFRKCAIFSASAAAIVIAQQAAAQDNGAAENGYNEIIVTAQKREQSLQDVSVAVSAVSADALANAGISNLQDMQQLVPSVTFGNDFNQAKVFIRGVGANTSTTGSSTGVALHVDGAYVARAEAQLTSLFDVERVEVLRGPQGSLYGRNAVGGSINIITAKPTVDTSGYVRLGYGNYNAITAEAAISGPIADWLRVRIAGKNELRDGYGRDPFNGWDVDDLNRKMVRGQAQILFSETADLLLAAEYFRQNDNSGAVHYYGPAFPGVARLATLGPAGIATKPRDLGSDEPPSVDTRSQSYTATLNWELSDAFSVTNIANYRRFKTQLIQDLDISAVVNQLPNPTTVQTRTIDAKQWSNEFQVKYDSDIVNGVVGLYYFGEHQRPRDQVGLSSTEGMASNIAFLATRPTTIDGVAVAPGSISLAYADYLCDFPTGVAPNRVCLRSRLNTEAWAAFGQLNFDLEKAAGLTGLTLKLGGRFSHEKVSTANMSVVMTANANPAAGAVLAFTDAPYTQGGTYRQKTFKDFTPEIGLSWQPDRNILLYYTYSEGFKAGSGENAAGSSTIVRPEKMKNHEVGAKLEMLDRKLTFNVAGYWYKLKDLQINKTVGGGPTGYTTIFENAARTEAKGVEIEWMLRPVHRVRLSGGVSYTDSKYKDFVTVDPLDPRNVAQPGQPAYDPVTNPDSTAFGAPCLPGSLNANGPCSIQLAGNYTRNSPRWSYNVHAEVDLVDDEQAGTVTLAGDMSGKSTVYFTEFNRLEEGAKAYTLFDAALRWTSAKDDLTASLWIKNIRDTLRASSTFAISTGRIIGATWLPPRTYGVTLGYRY